jgi:DNA polymerase V
MPRGGKRDGAGRKPNPTKPVRVPVAHVGQVKLWLSKLKQDQVEVLHPKLDSATIAVPLYGSQVRAGFPSPADDYIENQLDLNEYLIKSPASTFLLKVQGDSMINAGIHEGDILVVDRSIDPKSGKVVIAAVNGELTVKTLIRRAGTVTLRAENDAYPDIRISEESDLIIWGVVTSVVRKV